jgi:hypothetical protein
MNIMIILSPVRIGEAGYNVKHGPNTSESRVVTWLMNVTWSYYRDTRYCSRHQYEQVIE